MEVRDHKDEMKISHEESLAAINKETGEIRYKETEKNKSLPEGKMVFEEDAVFKKTYTISWQYLKENFSPLEFRAAFSLAMLAKANSNSLEPLSDETTYIELSQILGVSKNRVDVVLKKLFEYGVYGRFDVNDKAKGRTKFWILNPYLSFSGRVIVSDIADLFRGTMIALNYFSKHKV